MSDVMGYHQSWSARHALLVGVSDYSSASNLHALPRSRDDVHALASALRLGENAFRVRCLTGEGGSDQLPTLGRVRSAILETLEQVGSEDLVLFYFSGHGLTRAGTSYLLPSDADPRHLDDSAISIRQLRERFAACRAAVKILIIDACHSFPTDEEGRIQTKDQGEDDEKAFLQSLKLEIPTRGMAFVASCRNEQKAYVWEKQGLSLFTHFLVKGLEGEAVLENKVTLSRLFAYASEQVQRWTIEHGQHAQTPVMDQQVDGEIALVVQDEPRVELVKVAPARIHRPPYQFLEPFTEADGGFFFGRDDDIRQLRELVLHHPFTVLTALSGAGKSSILRAGLTPDLNSRGIDVHYVACREEPVAALAARLGIHPPDELALPDVLAESLTRLTSSSSRRIVLIFDQLESLYLNPLFLPQQRSRLLNFFKALARLGAGERTGRSWGVAVVMGIREDHLSLILPLRRALDIGPHQEYFLPPLDRRSASLAITAPLEDHPVRFSEGLLTRLLDDLVHAGKAVFQERSAQLGGRVYPPHLQVVCTALFRAATEKDSPVSVEFYEAMGGLERIFADHLEQLFKRELTPSEGETARDIFKLLVGAGGTRRTLPRLELCRKAERVYHRAPHEIARVLEQLESRRLLNAVRVGDEPCYELMHDFLVVRLASWVDAAETDRRTAINQLKDYLDVLSHVPTAWAEASLCQRVQRHPEVWELLELEGVPAERLGRLRWGVRRSTLLRRVLQLVGLGVVVLALVGLGGWAYQRMEQAREQQRFAANIGAFELQLSVYDLSDGRPEVKPLSALPSLRWRLLQPQEGDESVPGEPLASSTHERLESGPGFTLREKVVGPSGLYFLEVSGRGAGGEDCPPSLLRLKRTPGYRVKGGTTEASQLEPFSVQVPSCQASRSNTVSIESGPFSFSRGKEPVTQVDLPAYRMDRFEITNADFQRFAAMEAHHSIALPLFPEIKAYARSGEPGFPVAKLTWYDARAYCQYMGKDLPTAAEWQKAARGGLTLGGQPNPAPLREAVWAVGYRPGSANLLDGDPVETTSEVGSFPEDSSPYGVMDMTGNVAEWLKDAPDALRAKTLRMLAGAHWFSAASADEWRLSNFNSRDLRMMDFNTGARCVERKQED